MAQYPATVQTTYANLVQMHLNRPEFAFSGAPFKRETGGNTYWYVNQRVSPGAAPRQRYLGPDTEETRARIEEMRASTRGQADFRDAASRLVAQLRAAGLPTMDRQTGTVLRAITNCGLFRLGGTLVGTQAFRHYDAVLGVDLSKILPDVSSLAQTEDLDIAAFEKLSLTLEDQAEPDLNETLAGFGFKARPSLKDTRPTSWLLPDATFAVDFLTPAFSDDTSPVHLKSLNVWAQPLHYLNFLIADPVPAVSLYIEGMLVQIPAPERYAVHKLIVAQLRHQGSAKAAKDIAQARVLIAALSASRPQEFFTALEEASSKGPKWKALLDRALLLTFKAPELRHDARRDVVSFDGEALGGRHQVSVSAEALEDHFEAKDWNAETVMAAARRHRGEIEKNAQRLFRQRPSDETLIRSEDIDRREA